MIAAILACASLAHADRPERAQRTREFRRELVERFDRNGDGRLGPRERAKAARALHRIANRLQAMPANQRRERLIRRFDLDGDGNLGPGELPPRVVRKLRRLDRNGDGWLQNTELP